ncbi:MAG: AIR synthase-related protein [Spirochaetes bacterium]|nr:AIR synthase-related protein [Spirochaetota bacterium]
MELAHYRIEIYYTIPDSRGIVLKKKLSHLGFHVEQCVRTDNYLINIPLTVTQIENVAKALIQPVTQNYCINQPYIPNHFTYAIEIGYLPGVTDNVAHTTREMIQDIFKTECDPEKSVFTTSTYFLWGDISYNDIHEISLELYNPLIQRANILTYDDYISNNGFGNAIPVVTLHEDPKAEIVSLNVSQEELLALGKEGIKNPDGTRRGPLALDMLSLEAIKKYYQEIEKRNPTDVELESIAQTWSEHCKHTIFAAQLDDINDGIFKHYIKEATLRIRREKGKNDICVSVFSDNAGGIEFDDEYVIADKVETHNSPSALDPFGGAITGIVGVNRDAIGFGLGAKPVANRYGFCFANPFDTKPLYKSKDKNSKMLSPRRIMEGVIHGVNVGGNCSGIPTPQGFVYFDDRYKGKPLVFVGTVGLIPKKIKGKSSVQKKAMPGDNIVMVGGRVGRDGIHGATFSSEALTSGSPATAVQIGDPITQKKLSDAIVKEARDKGLYHSITDNGAGGLSCSVSEMAREAGGFIVYLDKVPLKYPGLAPWQIWVSESQERMTLAVPDETLQEFLNLMKRRGVDAWVIGKFTDSGRGIVYYNNEIVFNIDLHFLHEGLPQKKLTSTYAPQSHPYPAFDDPLNATNDFIAMVQRLNTASFEFISTQYDHEVQGNSVIKPLQGKGKVNGNATVIRPVLTSKRGVVLSHGLYPSYSDIDTYWMAACSIDTAVRNAVAAGCDFDRLALLDNFCWCDSTNPYRLGQLKEAARACYDFAVAYKTPFISGKDSMFNDFKGYDENFNEVFISVPPTLLISSIGVVSDISYCQTLDFKKPGDLIYILGITNDELGGSEYLAYMGEKLSGKKYIGSTVPKVDPQRNSAIYITVEKALRNGLIASSASVERGGIAIALAKSSMGGLLGAHIDLSKIPHHNIDRNDTLLYSESQGRILVSIAPENKQEFEALCKDIPFAHIGYVENEPYINVIGLNNKTIISISVNELHTAYKSTFSEF